MSWTPVGSVVTTGDTGIAGTIVFAAQNHASGKDIFVGLGWNFGGGAVISSVTDTAGNTYANTGVSAVIGSNIINLWRAFNITGNAANIVTATMSGTGAYRSGAMLVMTPPGTATQNDAKSGSAGSGTALSTGALSVYDSDALVVTFGMAISDSNTAGSGYTQTAYAISGDAVTYWAIQYKAVSTTETPAAGCANGAWGMVAASFSAGSAPPTGRGSFGFVLN